MRHAAVCYIPKLDKSGLILGILHPKLSAWALPGGKLEPGESPYETALRELREETGLCPRPSSVTPVYLAVSSHDPGVMVHVYQMDVGPHALPQTCEPGKTVAWVTPFQLCDSKAFGPFYQKFFVSRRVGVSGA